MASPKQVSYALRLMERAGFGIRYMNADHKRLGATMSERRGAVEDWLRGKSSAECSALIDRLEAGRNRIRPAPAPAPAPDAGPAAEEEPEDPAVARFRAIEID